MRERQSERGFTLVELLIASLLTMVVMGVAFSSFSNALQLNEQVVNLTDASQNLRAGTNLLVRDLLQAGRHVDIGGIPIPSGPTADPVHRPGPTGTSYVFDNDEAGTTLSAITTGATLGPTVAGRETDLVTVLMGDPLLDHLDLYQSDAPSERARLAEDGGSFDVAATGWHEGDGSLVPPIAAGDLIYFTSTSIGSAVQTVTRVEGTRVYFDADDPFNLNQRNANAGSITQILPDDPPACDDDDVECHPVMTVRRLYMYSYFVEEDSSGIPRLMRAINHFPATALAGVIEDLELSYDLVDGVVNPTNVKDLPYTANAVTYTASQIRKVNVHVGVRSEVRSSRTNDYLRNHLSTVISLRNLAYVDRYQ
jgi:type II secretory pathway pseudopilin PulG